MSDAGTAPVGEASSRILSVVKRYWGFDRLLPLQAEAIEAGIACRDSLVVLPTGGGKSLCYQVPPAVAERMDVVVSPLISLMKDQVDGLRQCGYPAAAVHSNLTDAERDEIRAGIRDGAYRLLFLSPERLASPRFLDFLEKQNVHAFAIDEAHCISHWGHDFRPEYRQLALLKERFPEASVHAYTATATERVRRDIIEQLGLTNPRVLIGTFDRPNLVYRIVPSVDVYGQIFEVLQRHAGEAVIIYCITRRDTEDLAAFLDSNSIRAAAYHAGLDKSRRTAVQDAYSREELDVVVATVAFGMGIDRSNVRCVIHAAMPKTIEHYQQETGRAGRDGLEAECVLFYSAADFMRWESILTKSAENAEEPEEVIAAQLELLRHMQGYCGTFGCRHRALSRYFGQPYESPNCGACDVCLGEVESMADSTTIAQKILSCVYRTGQRFGVGYVVDVLRGADTEQVRQRRHHKLSVYGLLDDMPAKALTNLVYQLVDQGLLARTPGDRPTLQLSEDSMPVLRGELEVQLVEPALATAARTTIAEDAWEGVDRGLFEILRDLRRRIAQERQVPAYVIFGDATLRELAKVRPASLQTMTGVRGIGERKLADLGPRFLEAITDYCREKQLDTDVSGLVRPRRRRRAKPNPEKDRAMEMFAESASVNDVARATGRAASTVYGYLAEYVQQERPADLDAWVPPSVYDKVIAAATAIASDGRLKPIHDHLGGEVPYELLRLIITHHRG